MALEKDDLEQVKKTIAEVLPELLGGDEVKSVLGKSIRGITVGVIQAELKGVTEQLEKLGDGSAFEEKLAELQKAIDEGKKDPKDKDKVDPEIARMQAEMKKLRDENEQRKQREDEANAKAAAAAKRSIYMSAADELEMRSKGIAYDHLERRIELSEDGTSATIKVQRDGFEEDVPVKQFLEKEFLPSEDGKAFAPAKDAGGTGSRRGAGGGTSGKSDGDTLNGLLDRVISGQV